MNLLNTDFSSHAWIASFSCHPGMFELMLVTCSELSIHANITKLLSGTHAGLVCIVFVSLAYTGSCYMRLSTLIYALNTLRMVWKLPAERNIIVRKVWVGFGKKK